METKKGKVMYLNSGDWIENLTALEYDCGEWSIYHYDEKKFQHVNGNKTDKKIPELNVVTDEVGLFINSLDDIFT